MTTNSTYSLERLPACIQFGGSGTTNIVFELQKNAISTVMNVSK